MCTEEEEEHGEWQQKVWVWRCCCLEAEVEMQLQRNSWRLWPTASQDAVSCLDAIIKQRQPLCSDTDSSTTQLRTHAHLHTRTGDVEVVQICRDEKLVHMLRFHASYLFFLPHSPILRYFAILFLI